MSTFNFIIAMGQKIIGIGEIVWDFIEDTTTGEVKRVLGGAPLNFAYFASQLGAESYIVSAVGNDELGKETADMISKYGVNLDFLQINDRPTGLVQAKKYPDRDTEYNICPEQAYDNMKYDPAIKELLANAKAVCWGTLAQRDKDMESRKAIPMILKNVPESCLKVYDINLRPTAYIREIVEGSLQYADVLKLNETEYRKDPDAHSEVIDMCDMFDLDEADVEKGVTKLMDMFPRLKFVIYTMGGDGSRIYSREGLISSMPVKKIPAEKFRDTVGAGDSFTASFITSYLQGKPIGECHRIAGEVSSFVCTQDGAINPLP